MSPRPICRRTAVAKTYLTISTGDSPKDARPILASDDPKVIQAAMNALRERAGVIDLSQRGNDVKGQDRGRVE
jgi:hypothetical protein